MVNVLVLTGYGINCDEETAFAFTQAGGKASIVHVNDLIKSPAILKDFDVMAFPGGFSYGDDTGSGNALANKMRNKLWGNLMEFVDSGKLVLGICNGFQVITNLGLLPGFGSFGEREVALLHNNSARYECRWVSLKAVSDKCVFTRGIESIRLPVAHGEGKFFASRPVLEKLAANGQIAFRYSKDNALAGGEFPFNPNGSLEDIAGICDKTGRVFGLMPHPERHIFFTQQDNWPLQKELLKRKNLPLPKEGSGLAIFRNAVDFFK